MKKIFIFLIIFIPAIAGCSANSQLSREETNFIIQHDQTMDEETDCSKLIQQIRQRVELTFNMEGTIKSGTFYEIFYSEKESSCLYIESQKITWGKNNYAITYNLENPFDGEDPIVSELGCKKIASLCKKFVEEAESDFYEKVEEYR